MRTLRSFSKSNLFSSNTIITIVIETESYPKIRRQAIRPNKARLRLLLFFLKKKTCNPNSTTMPGNEAMKR